MVVPTYTSWGRVGTSSSSRRRAGDDGSARDELVRLARHNLLLGRQTFTDLRKELFKEKFPASALITCDGLARTDMLVEVQGIAMIA